MTGWREIPLGEACELYQPKTISTAQLVDDGPYEVFGANGVIGRYHSYNHEEPQLLVTCRGATCGTVNKTGPKAWINGNAMVVRPKSNDIDMNYLEHLLRGGVDLSAAITGAAQPQITRQSLAPIRAKFPNLSEQRRIAAILDQADALHVKRREALNQLNSLTQWIFIEMFGDPATNPKGWPMCKIGDLLESASYGTSEKSKSEGQFPVLRMNNITRSGDIDLTDLKYMDLDESEYDRYLVKSGDVLFNRTNSADLVGKTAIYRHAKSMAYAGYLIRLRTNTENDPEYLGRFLNTTYAKKMLRGMCKSIIGMANINATEIQAMRICKPPLEIQREFGRRINAIEKEKEIHRKSLAELENLFASLQNRAFRGEL